jgi:hypothetical protein
MFKKNIRFAFFCICIIAAGCNTGSSKQPVLKFESVSDSLYKPDDNYKQGLVIWKHYYEQCMNQQLFADAFYLQLQDKINIGSINNDHEMDVNKGIQILDTTNNKNIFNLLAIMNSANCSDTMHLNSNLRKNFYAEVTKALSASPEYKNLPAIFDSTQMNIRVGTIFYDALRPDSLISILTRTTDSSLIRYKELLLKPENALLAQTVDMLGFNAEFPLKNKLTAPQEMQLKKGVSYNLNNSNDKVDIVLLSNNIRIQINKRYSVLGKFLKLKAE